MTQRLTVQILERIAAALEASRARFLPALHRELIENQYKIGHDPVTEADRALDAVLRKELLRDGEGWLSEEECGRSNSFAALEGLGGRSPRWHSRIREGHPRGFVSIGFVESGRPVAGGIYDPADRRKLFWDRLTPALRYDGKPSQPSQRRSLNGALVLASRSEVKRGEWQAFENAEFTICPMGSVAYKLALVSAGFADITFTLTPKNEWDVVAGAALVQSAGAFAAPSNHADRQPPRSALSGLGQRTSAEGATARFSPASHSAGRTGTLIPRRSELGQRFHPHGGLFGSFDNDARRQVTQPTTPDKIAANPLLNMAFRD